MKKFVLLPKTVYRALYAAAESYAEDLSTGLDDGTYDDDAGADALAEALLYGPAKVKAPPEINWDTYPEKSFMYSVQDLEGASNPAEQWWQLIL